MSAVLALVAAALFAGAALYITVVEHPARATLSTGSALAHWQPSYKRAAPIQGGLALAGFALGLLAWGQTGRWQLAAGAVVLLANWPFTLVGILPTNRTLLAAVADRAEGETRRLLERWGRLHAVRSALGVLATTLLSWGVAAD